MARRPWKKPSLTPLDLADYPELKARLEAAGVAAEPVPDTPASEPQAPAPEPKQPQESPPRP